MNNPALFERIEAFDIDGQTVAFPFAKRLAQENGWSHAHALRAIQEYKRFAYLCMVAGPCTPSDAIDQVWHLHMLYTRSYWERWCGETLPRALNHGPTLGGREEAAKFDDWYTKTLDSYRAEFGEEPPADLWPAPEARDQGHFQRVNLDQHWVLPKQMVYRAFQLGLLGAAALGLAGCAYVAQSSVDPSLWFMLLFLGIIALVLFLAIKHSKGQGNSNGGSGCGGGCGGGHSDGGDSGCGSGCGGGCGGD